ncbi:hypothetical protein HHI36_020690 [Cryptolaemus montrouzieri]|uniref:Peptidoglycan recognition protein family domain-containing protein n=1 Tax=Cryptolaemus montrouzieri TaxID=559131 RepID=A0ABD2NB96_9CUCU
MAQENSCSNFFVKILFKMNISRNPEMTGPCRACLAQIQNPSMLVNEYTPLIYRPQPPRSSRFAVLLFGLLMLILCFGFTIGFYLITVETRDIQAQDVIMFSSRHNWKAENAVNTQHLHQPCKNIMLLFTNSTPCFDYRSCSLEMRNLQKSHMRSNHSDLLYNFVIANDNRIYEGRGWKYVPDLPGNTDNDTISVAFLGYPGISKPTAEEINQMMLLINFSITNHKLIHCFNIFTKPEELNYLEDIISRIREDFIHTRCF